LHLLEELTNLDSGTVLITYDALGRRLEQNNSGVYTQIVYGPDGSKLALMSGHTISKLFLPLPGQAQPCTTPRGEPLPPFGLAGQLQVGLDHGLDGVYYDGAYNPFVEAYYETGTAARDFTGQNQDLVSGCDFPFRRYYAMGGPLAQPGPGGQAAVDPALPQSWNRYVYVSDNPLTGIDPLGLWITQIGSCFYDSVGVYVDGEYQGTDTQSVGCFATLQPWLSNTPKTVATGGGGGGRPRASSTAASNTKKVVGCFFKAAAMGAVGAVVVGGAAVLAVTAGAPVAVATGVLGGLAVVGGAALGIDIVQQPKAGSSAGSAYHIGSVAGGIAVGAAGGGTIANGIKPGATSGWSPASWVAQRFNPSFGSISQWLGTGPTAASAGVSAALAGAGGAQLPQGGGQ
jgi:hypothetical protein